MTPERVTDNPLPYLRYVPEGQDYPLLLFLHGSGERGSDLAHVGDHGLADILAHLPEPTLVLAPQCPEDIRWIHHLEGLEAILDSALANYPVDRTRIYLTGLSMGGQGTWYLGAKIPERFAALVPICGRSNPEEAERLKDLPIWVFHGAEDTVIPVSESEGMVIALQTHGSDVKLTVYPDTEHNSWTPAYREADLYTWLFNQRRDS